MLFSVKVMVAPPELLSMDSLPPCASMTERASESPRPRPSCLVVVKGATALSAEFGIKARSVVTNAYQHEPGGSSRTSIHTLPS